jgi:hypothetical protein
MSHNTPQQNADFRAAWDATNARYRAGNGPTCPHCARDLETPAELAAGLCTSDDCPRHEPVADIGCAA